MKHQARNKNKDEEKSLRDTSMINRLQSKDT